MAEIYRFPVGPDGLYAYDRLDEFWVHPHLILSDDAIAGFALVIDHCPITGTARCWFMAEFFVMRPYRRQGFGTAAALSLIGDYPGLWHIGVIERNEPAARFWAHLFEPFDTLTTHHDHDGERWLVHEFEA
jgi:predicted acetyltransferase